MWSRLERVYEDIVQDASLSVSWACKMKHTCADRNPAYQPLLASRRTALVVKSLRHFGASCPCSRISRRVVLWTAPESSSFGFKAFVLRHLDLSIDMRSGSSWGLSGCIWLWVHVMEFWFGRPLKSPCTLKHPSRKIQWHDEPSGNRKGFYDLLWKDFRIEMRFKILQHVCARL